MGYVKNGNEGRRNGNNKGLRDNTVVGVGDRDGAVVKGEEGTFFGDEKEDTVVEAVRRSLPGHEAAGDEREHRGRVLARDPVGLEGDAVWARGGVVGGRDGLLRFAHPGTVGTTSGGIVRRKSP